MLIFCSLLNFCTFAGHHNFKFRLNANAESLAASELIEPLFMIRIAQRKDLTQIDNIYTQAALSKFETADTEPLNANDRLTWFDQHTNHYPIYVYEQNDKVVAWLSLSAYRFGRQALRYTVEISYYVDKDHKSIGIGSKLIEFAIKEAKNLSFKSLIAIVLDRNTVSIKLLEKYGFAKWGHLPDIADFNGDECGHVYYGLKL